MSLYGNLFDAHTLEKAVLDHTKSWISAYLGVVEEQKANLNKCDLQRPNSYITMAEFDRAMLEEQLPSIMVVSPGLVDEPNAAGDGMYTARWQVAVCNIVSAATKEDTDIMMKVYCAAIRGLMLQQKVNVGGFRGAKWLEERYDETPPEESRSLAVGMDIFSIEIEDVGNWKAGPKPPPPVDPCAPSGDWPIVQPGQADSTVIKT